MDVKIFNFYPKNRTASNFFLKKIRNKKLMKLFLLYMKLYCQSYKKFKSLF